jgi:soluble lytic murein transglycosylase-like protein
MACIESTLAAAMCVGLTAPQMYAHVEQPTVREIIIKAAQFHSVPESLALAIAETESNFNCEAIGKRGEIGLFQLKATTAFYLGHSGNPEELKDCVVNAFYGVLHLRKGYELCGKDIPCTITKHNAGLRAKPRPLSAYNSKVKKKMVKAQAWVK